MIGTFLQINNPLVVGIPDKVEKPDKEDDFRENYEGNYYILF